jgi:phosphatidylserine decarboxylase
VYNHFPVKIVRKIGLFFGWLTLIISISRLLVLGTMTEVFPSMDAIYGLILGVLIIWLSIERIHPEGYKFFSTFLVLSILAGLIFPLLGALGFLLTVFVLWFFRDPERNPPSHDCIVSPADGVVCKIDQVSPPEECNLEDKNFLRICIFMNVFNVHVNRSPINGLIKDIIYVKGKFFNASLDKASKDNERNILVLENQKSETIVVVQIAGLIARRILSFVKPAESLSIAERFGLIRFGSRVDVYLPAHYVTDLEEGAKVIAGESIIARATS